jgi:hypothetical protein
VVSVNRVCEDDSMMRPKIGAGRNREPTGRTVKLWVDSVSSATLPLLAGFSTTAVVVVADDARNFRWSGWTILPLAIAAVVLIAAAQFAYHARIALAEWCEHVDAATLSTPSREIRQRDAEYKRGVFLGQVDTVGVRHRPSFIATRPGTSCCSLRCHRR